MTEERLRFQKMKEDKVGLWGGGRIINVDNFNWIVVNLRKVRIARTVCQYSKYVICRVC